MSQPQTDEIKDEIRLLPDMTKGRHARTVFVSAKLKAELQAYAHQAKCVDRSYPFFASQKSIRAGFNANSLAQTFACSTKELDLKALAATADAEHF